MSVMAAAIAAGAGMINSRRGRNQADDAADDAQRAAEMGIGEMQKGISMLDKLQPAIDQFAKSGQDSFNRYQDMLGPLEDSLNDYYMNLNPDELASQGNQAAQQQYQQSMNQVNDQLAAQGIQNSGVSGQMGMEYGNQMAQTKAQNIVNAPGQVAQQQAGWAGQLQGRSDSAFNQYQAGVGAQQGQANAYQNAYNNMANIYGGHAANNNQMAQQGYTNANQSLQSGAQLAAYLYGKG